MAAESVRLPAMKALLRSWKERHALRGSISVMDLGTACRHVLQGRSPLKKGRHRHTMRQQYSRKSRRGRSRTCKRAWSRQDGQNGRARNRRQSGWSGRARSRQQRRSETGRCRSSWHRCRHRIFREQGF